jgi:hypothetical protein
MSSSNKSPPINIYSYNKEFLIVSLILLNFQKRPYMRSNLQVYGTFFISISPILIIPFSQISQRDGPFLGHNSASSKYFGSDEYIKIGALMSCLSMGVKLDSHVGMDLIRN